MRIQPAMWVKALKTMPRMSRPEWDGLDIICRWLATLVGKHLDKMDMDREKHVTTFPVLVDDVATRHFTPVMVLPLVSLVYFFKTVLPMFRKARPTERPEWYPADAWPHWYVASTFVFTRRFGSLSCADI